jgi:hypothetical protein
MSGTTCRILYLPQIRLVLTAVSLHSRLGCVGGHRRPRLFSQRVLPPVLLPVLVAVPAAVFGKINVQFIVLCLTGLPSDRLCLGKA